MNTNSECPSSPHVRREGFVISAKNGLGVGRIVELFDALATVEYFSSPALPSKLLEVRICELQSTQLPEETRVYRQGEGSTWQIGRVLDYQTDDCAYLVRFPNSSIELVPESQLNVRSHSKEASCVEHLAHRLNETPFWHAGRRGFVDWVFSQKQACAGMPAALSAAVELVHHQLAVVHRVLHDPFQRYLLADEVGLGKTIEAGILIRQHILDHESEQSVLIVVPEVLKRQWNQELRDRFYLDDELGQTIHVVAHDDQAAIGKWACQANLVVIDEAHHVAAWALSATEWQRDIYRTLQDALEEASKRVLLLSATPVLHNEVAFLAMLQLLDPSVYSLDDIDSFRKRVQNRQAVAESLLSLSEDEADFFLESAIDDLSAHFTDDEYFGELAQSLRELLQEGLDENDKRRVDSIRALRSHVSETWRLHRRMLRNRRTSANDCYLPGRDGSEVVEWKAGPVDDAIADLLREWRAGFSDALYDTDGEPPESVCNLVRLMEETAACDPTAFVRLVDLRLGGEIGSEGDFATSEIQTAKSSQTFDGEVRILQQLSEVASSNRQLARRRQTLKIIESLRSENHVSIVVFTNFPCTADAIYSYLAGKLRSDVVLRHDSNSSGWTRFHRADRGMVLVCDRSAEEGLNLQNRRSAAVHYDLPFSPNRVEQRLGRLDRFGSGKKVRSYVLVPSDESVERRWHELLETGLGVFTRSVASLQYVIDEQMRKTWAEFIDSGSDAIISTTDRLSGEEGIVADELRRIRAQDEIDSFEDDRFTEDAFEKLLAVDRRAGSQGQAALSGWLKSRLHFRESGEEGRRDGVIRYQLTRRDDATGRGRNTLVPYEQFTDRCQNSMDWESDAPPFVAAETLPLAFQRQVAQRRLAQLSRVGNSFVDAIENYIRWDDRGVCFALWRYRPSYECHAQADLAFRIDFVIEPAIEPLEDVARKFEVGSLPALKRRADEVFGPIATSVWIDSDLEPLSREASSIFAESYRSSAGDFNLNPARWIAVAEFMDISFWYGLCNEVVDRAESLLRERGLPARVDAAEKIALSRTGSRIQQLESRQSVASSKIRESIEEELAFEECFRTALVKSVTLPTIRVDAIGAVFVSPHNPFAKIEIEGDDE